MPKATGLLIFMALGVAPIGIIPGDYNASDIGALAAIMGAAQVAVEGFQRATMDWGGNTGIPCNASELEEGKELDIVSGGWVPRKKCKITVQFSNLPDPTDPPRASDDVIIHLSESDTTGTKLRILKTRNSYDTTLQLECVDTNHP